jgi:hypothetical protein
MKITESRLRKIIRRVIKENSYDYSSDYQENDDEYKIRPNEPTAMSDLLYALGIDLDPHEDEDELGIDPHEEESKVDEVARIACKYLNCRTHDLDSKIEELQARSDQSFLDLVSHVGLHMQ